MAERKIPSRPASAQDIKAFTHPLRMRLFRILADVGQATATMLARETGESSGQTSYHLRQLEKYGFVEEVPDRGTARERWWKPVGFSFQSFGPEGEVDIDPSVDALTRFMIDEHAANMSRWAEQVKIEPNEWRLATTSSSIGTWMTRDELASLSEALEEVLDIHTAAAVERHERGERAGERRIRAYVDTIILPD